MAIRFHCQRCRQLLGIASRKAGTEIQCPECGASQVVPAEEAAAAALVMNKFAVPKEVPESSSQVVVYDDEPAPIETPRRRLRRQNSSGAGYPPAIQGDQTAGEPVPEGMILYRRETLYLQGVLFLVLALIAFGAGYFIGRGDASFELQVAQQEASRELVLVEGRLVYDLGTGLLAGDEDAVIIALPDGTFPQETLPIQGIRPQDPVPGEDHRSVRLIRELGGAYARADDSGAFSMILPRQGKYRLLLVSRRTARHTDHPIDELDENEMAKYFQRAENLVSRYKYRWTLEEFNVGSDPITCNFGQDGKEDS